MLIVEDDAYNGLIGKHIYTFYYLIIVRLLLCFLSFAFG